MSGCGRYVHGSNSHTEYLLTHISSVLLEAERTEIILWLSRIPYRKHHERAKEGRLDNTGDWLVKKKVFKEWQGSSTSKILWLHGIRKSSVSHTALDWC